MSNREDPQLRALLEDPLGLASRGPKPRALYIHVDRGRPVACLGALARDVAARAAGVNEHP